MKKEINEFNAYVRSIRNTMPKWNNDREVVVLSEYSKAGKSILEKASRYEAYYLWQVYEKPSQAKQDVYDSLFEMYANDADADAFGICSYNGFAFTVSWVTKGEVLFFTKSKEVHVICNE